jgi:hypothetical protein
MILGVMKVGEKRKGEQQVQMTENRGQKTDDPS